MTESDLRVPAGLSPLQCSVLSKMLDHPGDEFARIRAQLEDSEVCSRESTGVGGYVNFSVPLASAFHGALKDGHIGGVYGIHSKLGVQGDFELCISDGCIAFLEYVTPDEEWPNDDSLFEMFSHDGVGGTKESPSEQVSGGNGG